MKATLQSINARILLAIDLLEAGRTEQATKELKHLSGLMPLPEQRNFDAAQKEKPRSTAA